MSRIPSREEVLFTEALARPADERTAFLERACGGDAALCARILALLKAHLDTESLLRSTAVQTGVVPAEKPGDRIGNYKLLQKLGEGGCGIVWMAAQEQPVRRQVALKIIKLGMDTKSVIARFEAERQALAMMDHPNIAKVLDAGATGSGRPFFVMELVRGVPITRFCDDHHLGANERLELFIQVCHAIQHAHQKGIIHRDIKPSNILVTLHDDVAVPSVIDFGIAKAAQGRLTDQTLFTAFEQFMGTPVYMSPEQAEFNALDVDTRSDIYSLGVLLYELLTGRPPFDPTTLAQAGIDHVRQIIRESEPPRPSTRIRTLSEAERTAIARLRGIAPAQLSTVLRADLDWIVMKAMEKNRTRRYQTANAFAVDLERYLDDEAVDARPPSAAYRIHKFILRHRLGFAAGLVVAVSLAGGLAVSTVALLREKAAHQRAMGLERAERTGRQRAEAAEAAARRSESAARTSEQLAADARLNAERLLTFVFTDVGEQLNELGQLPLLRKLTGEILAYYEQLNPALRTRESQAGYALAIAGIPTSGWLTVSRSVEFELGDPAERKRLEHALQMMTDLEASGTLTPFMRAAYAGVLWSLAGQCSREGRGAEGIPLCVRAEQLLEPALADPKWGRWADRFTTLLIMGRAHLRHSWEASTSIPEWERALARAVATDRRDPSHGRPGLQAATIRVRLSAALFAANRYDEAQQMLADARHQLRLLLVREPFLMEARNALGQSARNLALQGRARWRFAECRAAVTEAQGEFLQVITADPTSWGVAGHLVGTWTADTGDGQFHYDWLFGDFAQAEAALRKGIALMQQPWATSDSRHSLVNAHHFLARLYAATGRDSDADTQASAAQNVRQRVIAERPWETEDARQVYWLWDEYQGRRVDFERLNWSAIRTSAERVLAALAKLKLPQDDPRLRGHRATAQRDLIRAALESGEYAVAENMLKMMGWEAAWAPLPPSADIQPRFDQLRELLTRIQVYARNGQLDQVREELPRIWTEVEAVFAAGPAFHFNQVQTARALLIRAEIEGNAAAKREWLDRATGYLRPAAAAGRLTRYERVVLLAAIDKQLAELAAP